MKTILFDQNETNWVLEDQKNHFIGLGFQQLANFLDDMDKNQVIFSNQPLKSIVEMFNNAGLQYGVEYAIGIGVNDHINVVFYKCHEKNIAFKDYGDFFGHTFNGTTEENLLQMHREIREFNTLSQIKDWKTKRSMDALVRNQIKRNINWEENYANVITRDEFFYFANWKNSPFRFISHEQSEKIQPLNFYDKNSFYQSIWENQPMPCGKPIYHFTPGKGLHKNCDHELQLIECVASGKVREGYLPALTKKQINFDFLAEEERIVELDKERLFITSGMFDLLYEFYDIQNMLIKNIVCFKTYKGDGFQKTNELFHQLRTGTTNKDLLKLVKIAENKFIGSQVSEKLLNFQSFRVDDIDLNSNLKIKTKNVRGASILYPPLYIFITDFARLEMIKTVQKLLPYVVSSNTDSLVLNNKIGALVLNQLIEIDPIKIGAFKREYGDVYGWFKSPAHYLIAKSIDQPGDIIRYAWSGVKQKRIGRLSLLEASEILKTPETEKK